MGARYWSTVWPDAGGCRLGKRSSHEQTPSSKVSASGIRRAPATGKKKSFLGFRPQTRAGARQLVPEYLVSPLWPDLFFPGFFPQGKLRRMCANIFEILAPSWGRRRRCPGCLIQSAAERTPRNGCILPISPTICPHIFTHAQGVVHEVLR